MRYTSYLLLGLASLGQVSAAATPSSLSADESFSTILEGLGVNPAGFSFSNHQDFRGNTQLTCAVLRKLFGSKVTSASVGGNYNAISQINWSQTCWTDPACIISPSSALDVSKTIIILQKLQTKFSVRSGGHMANPGFSNAGGDAVLISLSNLKKLSLRADRSTVTIGVGNRWGTIYNYLQPYNVTVVGGRIGTVGTGLVLGGGLNYFSARFGLAADTVERFQVVLSDGSIINATRQQNADLFQALKGGSANFGIVTEFDMRTRSSGLLYYEALLFPTEQYPAMMKALVEYQQNGIKDTKASLVSSFRAEGNLLIFLYLDPVIRPPAFSPFYNLTAVPFFPPGFATITDLVAAVAIGFPSQPERDLNRVTSFEIDERILEYSFKLYRDVSATLPVNATLEYVPQPITTDTVKVGNTYGGNILGISAKSQIWLNIVAEWLDPAYDAFMFNATKFILDETDKYAKSLNKYLPFVFLNDASYDQKVLQGYGTQNFAKIIQVSKKYDKAQTFQKLQGNGYLWTRA
ncbi:hypothetical protein TWF694_001560 [Orbilia ellipsospora]|uniref:FAD-binding PCMH-type domain-containing protein n=1 Tax=Orbilia ellipsospora TaxID=2528407 RepID=A0AAV9XTU2_9PEZI